MAKVGKAMLDDVITLGTLTIRQKADASFEGYTVGREKSLGKMITFHVTDQNIDINLGYVIFINGERDIRALEVQKQFNTFGRLIHGLRLAIQPVPDDRRSLYAELRQALPKDPFAKHETLHPTVSEFDLDQGAGLSVFNELRKVGAEVGSKQELLRETGKRSPYLCVRFTMNNLWAPIVAYTATRILPISRGFTGAIEII
jgi:hypothetical protein